MLLCVALWEELGSHYSVNQLTDMSMKGKHPMVSMTSHKSLLSAFKENLEKSNEGNKTNNSTRYYILNIKSNQELREIIL